MNVTFARLTDTRSLLMTTNIVTTSGISSTVVAASMLNTADEDISIGSAITVEYELSTILFDIITSVENSGDLFMTTSTLSSNAMAIPISPTIINIHGTAQMESATVLLATTNILSANRDSNSVIVDEPTSVPSKGNVISSSNTGAIVGATVGVIILIAVTIFSTAVIFIVRKRRVERKYHINWTQQAGDH